MNSAFLTDGYKTGHKFMVPPGTEMMYSNMTPRSGKYAPKGCTEVVSFQQQKLIRQVHDHWFENFFSIDKDLVCGEIQEELTLYLGLKTPYDVSHFEQLHDLGYLPLEFKAIPEGDLVPFGVPLFTVRNTEHIDKGIFDWITNYLETIFSTEGWKGPTAATIALAFRKLGLKYAKLTDKDNLWFVDWQFHDFSMRGLDGTSACVNTGLGHASCNLGSDTLPVIWGARKYYGMPRGTFVVGSVNATEHSVMCAGIGFQGELETYKRLMKQFSEGILSLVSDTMDLWLVISYILTELKDEVLGRDGKVVIRPDSGNPVYILTGYKDAGTYTLKELLTLPEGYFCEIDGLIYVNDGKIRLMKNRLELKGVIEALWDIFGGTTNAQGFKKLNDKIGAIYGDSINIDRAEQIFERLMEKGFASTNVVLGIGSFTYQFITRDTFGFAVKATMIKVDGKLIAISKDPITDDGTKKSAKGFLAVHLDENSKPYLQDQVTEQEERGGLLQTIYLDGKFYNQITLTEVRNKLMAIE